MPKPKKFWELHEADMQEVLGLNSTIGSGNQFHDIGDGSTGHNRLSNFPLVIDAKCTEKGSYSVNRDFMKDWLQKAAELGKMFLLPIRFQKSKYEYDDYVVLELNDLLLLLELAEKGLKN